ncbi:MAG: DUF86 domain-containing protein [Nitrospirae bacterium]|nr:DUF86 domain-containing protein [Nitrospirota bacterium]
MDTRLIRKKLGELEKYVQALEKLKPHTLQELRSDMVKAWSVEHGLQLAIQTVIDTGSHILAALGEQEIEDYADVMDKLGERNILPAAFAKTIRGMVGVRNILVHEYAAVDLKKIHEILKSRLDDFRKFAKCIDEYLSSSSKS